MYNIYKPVLFNISIYIYIYILEKRLEKKDGDEAGDICEKRNKTTKTIARPIAKFILYIPAKIINIIRIILPKSVSNKLTNMLGIVNITSHKMINNVIKPTTKFIFFCENVSFKENVIIYYTRKILLAKVK